MHLILSRKWLAGLFSLATGIGLLRGRSDVVLVRNARARDREAFEELMRTHSTALRRFATRRLPASDVDDVLQETWLAAWERLTSLDDGGRFRAWIFSICYHKIQDSWRRHHSWPERNVEGVEEVHATYLPKEYAQVELRECLKAFWAACPVDQREVLRMYYADGLTLAEISQVLGRNLNTVKYQFYRAHELAAGKLPNIDVLLGEVDR